MSLYTMESTVAVVLLALLPCLCTIVSAEDIECEVDGSLGRCWKTNLSCSQQVNASGSCPSSREAATGASRDVGRVAQRNFTCTGGSSCGNEWLVDNVYNSARCKPAVVNVTHFYHFNNLYYIAEVYWKYSVCVSQSCPCGKVTNLVGVQVSIQSDSLQCSDTGDGGSTTGNCCYCQSTNYSAGIEGQKFNITIQYNGTNNDSEASETVRVFSYPLKTGDKDLSKYSKTFNFDRLVNCYDERLPVDLARCGVPRYGKPNHASAANYSVDANGDYMNVTLMWKPPLYRSGYPEPTEYYLKLREVDSTSSSTYFRVTNTTQVVLTHLNASKTYDVELQVYDVCSGINNRNDEPVGCGEVSEIELMYKEDSTGIPVNATADTPRVPSSSVGSSVDITIGTVVALLLVLAILISVCVIIVWRKCQSDGKLPSNNDRPPDPANRSDSSSPETGSLSSTNQPPSVLVVYSDRTQKKKKDEILHTLLGVLRQECGIQSTCHECFMEGDAIVFQVADKLAEADAVLCVCNKAFCQDWNSNSSPPVINALKQMIAAEISSGGNLSKYAMVFMSKQDKKHCIPYHFLQNTSKFLINDLDHIVGFIKNIPRIEIPSVNQEV